MINLDTHIFLGALEGRLRPAETAIANDFWCISDIVLWEIGHLEREGRIRPALRSGAFDAALKRTTVFPIDRSIARALARLDFRSDPADEIIAATSIVHDVPLVTRDMRILRSKVVPLAIR